MVLSLARSPYSARSLTCLAILHRLPRDPLSPTRTARRCVILATLQRRRLRSDPAHTLSALLYRSTSSPSRFVALVPELLCVSLAPPLCREREADPAFALAGRHRVHHGPHQLQHCAPCPVNRSQAYGCHCHDYAQADALPVRRGRGDSALLEREPNADLYPFLPRLTRALANTDTKAKSEQLSSSAVSTRPAPTSTPSRRTGRPTSSPT